MGSFSEKYNPILFGQTSGYRIFPPSYNGVRFFLLNYTLHITRCERYISFHCKNFLCQIFPCKNLSLEISMPDFFFSEISHILPNVKLC